MASKALGGAETYSTDVMLSLHAQGIDQCVAIPRNAPRYEELKKAGLRLAPWVFAVPLRFIQKILMRFLIAREKPDIVQCWMRRAASLAPRPSSPAPIFIGWFGGYYDPSKFTACTHFVGVTKDIVTHMIANGVPMANAHFIPTFPDIADLPSIDRADLNTPAKACVLLTLLRLHPKKGLDTFLHALKELPDCVAWLAGDGPLRDELERLRKIWAFLNVCVSWAGALTAPPCCAPRISVFCRRVTSLSAPSFWKPGRRKPSGCLCQRRTRRACR